MSIIFRSTLCTIAATAIFSCIVGDTHVEDEGVLDLDSALLVRSRDRLEVCVQVDPALAGQTDHFANLLRADLRRLQTTHPDWRAAGLDGDFAVVVGCPGDAIASQLADDKGTFGAVIGPGLRAAPSQFRVHVHVMGDATAAVVLGDRPFARAIAELAVVDEHRIAEVSTAVIVRAPLLGGDEFRGDALAQSLGLRVQ